MTLPNSLRTGPDEHGRFGIHGGRFVAETLMPLILELEQPTRRPSATPPSTPSSPGWSSDYVGRPSPLYDAERLTEQLGGAKIYFKRDELNHTGAHKINNVHGPDAAGAADGQAAHHRRDRRRAARRRHRHGLRAASGCTASCTWARDIERQELERVPHEAARRRGACRSSRARETLKDALNEALRDWVTNFARHLLRDRHGGRPASVPGDGPRVSSGDRREAREQMLGRGRLPDALVACVGGGSNAMGLFHPFLDDRGVRIVGVEAPAKASTAASTRRP